MTLPHIKASKIITSFLKQKEISAPRKKTEKKVRDRTIQTYNYESYTKTDIVEKVFNV